MYYVLLALPTAEVRTIFSVYYGMIPSLHMYFLYFMQLLQPISCEERFGTGPRLNTGKASWSWRVFLHGQFLCQEMGSKEGHGEVLCCAFGSAAGIYYTAALCASYRLGTFNIFTKSSVCQYYLICFYQNKLFVATQNALKMSYSCFLCQFSFTFIMHY